METAVLSKRIGLYLINLILYLGVGFASGVIFLKLLNVGVLFYVLISVGITIVASFFFDMLLLGATRGYTIGSAIFGVQYVAPDGKHLTSKQIIIRSASESILIFAIFDLFYFLKNRTERGVIDRLSDSFAIDNRR